MSDNFPGTTIFGTSGSITIDASGFTREGGEPFTYNQTSQTAWFTWVSASDSTGIVSFNTGGSTIVDTVLGIFTGDSVSSLVLVGSDDDSFGSAKSVVSFAPLAATTYRIQVGNYTTVNSGSYTLNWAYSAPSLDVDIFPGLPISSSSGQTTASSSTLTRQGGEPVTFGQTSQTAWFTWVAPYGTAVSFNTIGSGVSDTVLGIFTGNSVGSLTLVTKDDDSAGGLKSIVTFTPTAGATYHIQIGNYGSGSTGLYVLNWSQVAPDQPVLLIDEFSIGPGLGAYTLQPRMVMPFFGRIDIAHYKINPGASFPCGLRMTSPSNAFQVFTSASYQEPGLEDIETLGWNTFAVQVPTYTNIILELTQGTLGFTGGTPYTSNGDRAQIIRQIRGGHPFGGGTEIRIWVIDWEDNFIGNPPLDARTWVKAVPG